MNFNFAWIPFIVQELRRYFATITQGALADSALQPEAIGSSVQPFDADLSGLSELSGTGLVRRTANNTYATLPYINPFPCDGRLTVASANPFGYSSQFVSADYFSNTLFFTPFNGDRIALYNSSTTSWDVLRFTETSISRSSLTAGERNVDIFAFNNNGNLTLELSDWASNSARATALAYQNGILVKAGTPTRRYLGTVRSVVVSGGTYFRNRPNQRFVINYYNRVLGVLSAADTTDHIYNTSTWRSWASNDALICSTLLPTEDFLIQTTMTARTGQSLQTAIAINGVQLTSFIDSAGPTFSVVANHYCHQGIGLMVIAPQELGAANAQGTAMQIHSQIQW